MSENQKIVETAQKRFALAVDKESDGRIERLDDIKFVRLGEQWPDAVKRDRERPGAERPMLTINRIFQFRNQIINEIRQNRPSIKCRPVDDNADVDTAEVLQGIIRHIAAQSNADIAIDTAAEWQVDTGLGYFRVITDYCDPESFDQDIIIKRVADPAKVYFDPESNEPDGSDAKWAFICEDYTQDDFKSEFPGIDTAGWKQGANGDTGSWFNGDTVRVAEYFVIESTARVLAQLQDGSIIWKDEVPKEAHELIIKERKSESKICKWYKLAGNEVVSETELPCSYIPVIPVYGSEVWVEGKRHLHGLTRFAKDPARLYNYMQSANTELLALAPRAPYVAAEGQLDGHEQEWRLANQVNLSVLTYNPVSNLGQVIPAPRREMPPSTNPGLEASMNRSIDDMKSTMGIFDASLGNRESDQSGKAIMSQQRQASIGNFHFSDNLGRSIKHMGKIIVEMIPKIYDTQRVARILGEDGEAKNVQIDPDQPQSKVERQGENGEIQSIYNLGVGKYDVIVDTGPSYATKREESAQTMLSFVQTDPQLLQIAGDIIFNNLDIPGSDEVAKRMKAMLPPQIQAMEKQEGGQQIDPQIEAQMNQMAQQMEHMSQALQEAQKLANDAQEKFDIERFNAQTNRLEAEHKIAMESTGLFHQIAQDSVSKTILQGNTGELDDPEKQGPTPQQAQQITSGDA